MYLSAALRSQLHEQVNTGYFYLEGDRYIPWFAENDEAFGFEFCLNEFAGVFIFVKKSDLEIQDGKLKLTYTVLKNPNKISDQVFASQRFVALVEENINDILTKVSEWEAEHKKDAQ